MGEFRGDVQLLEEAFRKACQAFHVAVHVNLQSFCNADATGMFSCKFFGLCWSPLEFIDAAQNAVHPMSYSLALPNELLEAVDMHVKHGHDEIARLRSATIAKWTQRAIQLDKEEKQSKSHMDPHLRNALCGKRLLLLREWLADTGYPDMGVCDELGAGVELIGEVAPTDMLPPKYAPALLTEEVLLEQAARVRGQPCGSSGDEDLDLTVWQKTLDEVSRGWLIGPMEADQVPHECPLSRRFGLAQKQGKVRLIDDFSESGVNSCVCESPVLHTTDVACALIALWLDATSGPAKDSELVARTFDLSSAYRQIGLSRNGRRFSHIRVFDPHDNCTRIFQGTVLPFAAVKSVHSFLRVARAIWWIGVTSCHLLWTSFYDDFICFCPPALSRCTELSVTAIFKLLGWVFAEEGDKSKPFSSCCEALGVVFCLAETPNGFASVCNTQKRVDELANEIAEVIAQRKLQRKQAQRLRGRMQFAESQIFGRTGRRCLRVLADFAEGRRGKLSSKDVLFLSLFEDRLTGNEPRLVRTPKSKCLLIFTDACYEPDARDLVCGLGGVLLGPDGENVSSL